MAVLTQTKPSGSVLAQRGLAARGLQLRLFLTCWLIYLLHFSPFLVKEQFLAMSLAEKHSIHVDDYVDLHSDLFEMPGRGTYMGGNPGASFLAAVPYALALPVVNRVAPVSPPRPGEQVMASYKEDRPNRLAFYRQVRQRGMDVRLGLAGMITSVFFMAPLSALGAVVMFRLFGRFGLSEKQALWFTLLYAFGTPVFFRSATLSPNLVEALFSLFAFALLWRPADTELDRVGWRYFVAGLLAGWTVLTDYSGVAAVGMLGLLVLAQRKNKPFWPALKTSLRFAAGALLPIALLLYYQWYCFGSAWLPSQYYMAKKYFLGYPSERGFGRPLPSALWALLFDPLYGLLVFAPIFAVALYHPVLVWRRRNKVPSQVAIFCWAFSVLIWVFFSCVHYTVRHQWQEGFRYLVPVIPFLFLLVADVVARLPRVLAYLLVLAAVVETWCLAMVRENPLDSLARVLLHGFELPWLTTLVKAAPQYFPVLAEGASPVVLFLVWGVLIWGIWRLRDPWRPADSEPEKSW